MAIVETLELRFRADMGRLNAQLQELAGQIGSLGAAFEDGRFSLSAGAESMISAVAEGLRMGAAASAAPAQAAASLNTNFARSIAAGASQSALAAQKTASAARFANPAALAAAVSAGASLGQGFANGIASKYGAVMSAANRIANAAVNRIRGALRIHSPSKVSFELGGYFGQGFAQGVAASISAAQRSAGALSAAGVNAVYMHYVPVMDAETGITRTVQQAVDHALGGVNLVVPLHVDGMKLGEASIRGINRLTRSTGRLMLEI